MGHFLGQSAARARSRFGIGPLLLMATVALPVACGDDDDGDDDALPNLGGRANTGGSANGGHPAGGQAGAMGGAAMGGATDGGHAGDISGGMGGVASGGAATGGSAGEGAVAGITSSGGVSSSGGSSGSGGQEPETGGSGAAGGSSSGGGAGGAGGLSGSGGTLVVDRTPHVVCDQGGAGGTDGGYGGTGGADSDGGALYEPATPNLGYKTTKTELGESVVPIAINGPGQVIVTATKRSGTAIACRSFLIDPNGVQEILIAGNSPCVEAIDINDAGRVVGMLQPSLEPFLWQNGASSTLSEAFGRPVAINNQNRIIFDTGLLWDAGIVTEITDNAGARLSPMAMNNHGQVVGAFKLWEDGVVTEIPVGPPMAINDLGHIVGLKDQWIGLWDGVSFHPHDNTDNVAASSPLALNNHDQFVGTRDESPGDWPASPFVGQGSRYTKLDYAGSAVDINDSGDIIGSEVGIVWTGGGRDPSFSVRGHAALIWSRGCPGACCGPTPD